MDKALIKKYWDNKILNWENRRYGKKSYSNLAIQKRMEMATKLIKSLPKMKILEVGCGSGILMESLKGHYIDYSGIDISNIAITKAKLRKTKNCEFICMSVDEISEVNKDFDIVISLGLIDWLEIDVVNFLVLLSRNKKYIHSYSKKNLLSIFHRIYINYATGSLSHGYKVRYFTRSEIKKIFSQSCEVIFYRKNGMGIAEIVSNI